MAELRKYYSAANQQATALLVGPPPRHDFRLVDAVLMCVVAAIDRLITVFFLMHTAGFRTELMMLPFGLRSILLAGTPSQGITW